MADYRNARAIALTAALLMGALAFVPRPVSSELGTGWNCSRTLIVTSCSQPVEQR